MVALYTKDWADCREMSLKNSDEWIEVLWIKTKGQASKRNLKVGVYHETVLNRSMLINCS